MRASILQYNKGMTLVELLVVLSIFAIISMTVAFNYSSYKSTTSVNVLAQDVALSIREAQGYAIGVKSVSFSGQNIFPGYGVHFSPSENGRVSGSSKSFILFADISPNDTTLADNNYNYTPDVSACDSTTISHGNECISIVNISGGDKIWSVCANDECSGDGSTSGSLDIVFHRPNPDATFCYKNNYSDTDCQAEVYRAGVIVQSQSNPSLFKKIIVWNTGQISVE